jgi:putative heme-binding domain-containing protein
MRCLLNVSVFIASISIGFSADAQQPISFVDSLKAIQPQLLVREARRRGDPKRGAIVFHTSAAGCVKCHLSGAEATPLGPDLARLGPNVNAQHLVESLLYPSRSIRKGYETNTIVTDTGRVVSGLVARENDKEVVLRDSANLQKEIVILKGDIDERSLGTKSMMPEGLMATVGGLRQFLDLTSYVLQVADGGSDRAAELKPSAEQLAIKDDSTNLDHARIIKRYSKHDFETGGKIYRGLCINCHGADGNRPSLPTARAFGTQKLKYGSDPYSMFMTLTRGNGLMAPTSHLSPQERYQVVHFIRQRFMEPSNPDYQTVTAEYLADLPQGTLTGEMQSVGDRDFGPALASQLGREITSALTVRLGSKTISYNLHSMDQAGLWKGGYLNLSATQHMRGRGKGVANQEGATLDGLKGWQWGHGGLLDYSRAGTLPRGPLPNKWFDYRGHYLHGNQVVLRYLIDGREILELPREQPMAAAVRHTLRIGPGDQLVLATAVHSGLDPAMEGVMAAGSNRPTASAGAADSSVVISGQFKKKQLGDFTASFVFGDTSGLTWSVDNQHRLVLRIPADAKSRLIEVVCYTGTGDTALEELQGLATQAAEVPVIDPAVLTGGGNAMWPEALKSVGFLGFEQGAYAVDTLSTPDATPWNTWFRTSALDFFPDGRMVVATYGGDIWVVSGVDEDLLELSWKRYAGGLYEPFGVKVVDGLIYVTCKDRLTRLHDLNGDGEADFYESFSADEDVSSFFHAFNFDLQTDSLGNFYYAKPGQYTSYALPGAVVKISPDGKKREIYCTGFRTPNGMGILPDDRLTTSDNQGNWMPASKISLLRPGGFYGYVQTNARGDLWAPDGGRIDHTKVVPPKTFDQPIIWMPQNVDNSSGGQIWVDDPRWGPLSGRLLHTSFGKGWLYYLMIQDVGDVSQAALVKLPHDFVTGIMRGRMNPKDGQVYLTGLDGWNGGGRTGLLDKGIQRVRYTGKPHRMIADCRVEADGLWLSFNFPLDLTSSTDLASYVVEQWNYQWRPSYGSNKYHPKTNKPGTESVKIVAATLSPDGRGVKLEIPTIHPVNQLYMRLNLKGRDGNVFEEEIYWTINIVPPVP